MSELATRAEDLAVAIEEECCRSDYVYLGSVATKLIEQALLAERRLVMEEILEAMILDDWCQGDEWERGYNDAHKWYTAIIESKLRAAAEKEVVK